jgi:AcrR family transcriptional regulator
MNRTSPPPTAAPRDRMIRSALILMGQQGVEATSFSQVLEHSGAPRGSIYHYFPGGKSELLEEATRYAGRMLVEVLRRAAAENDDPVEALSAVGHFWRTNLADSDFAAGCPVVAAALEGDHGSSGARRAATEAFELWQQLYTEMLERAGVLPERAKSLGATAIAAVEGAVILSRAQGSNQPLEAVLDEVGNMFRLAIGRD